LHCAGEELGRAHRHEKVILAAVGNGRFRWAARHVRERLGPRPRPDSAFSAQLGSVTYYAVTRSYGHPAYIEVRGARRGLKRLDLGTYVKLEQAKQACERHYRAGCDLSNAERIIR